MSAEYVWPAWESTGSGSYVAFPRAHVCGVTYHLRVTDTCESVHVDNQQSPPTVRVVEFLQVSADDREPSVPEPFDHIPYDDDRFAWAVNELFDEFAGDTMAAYVIVEGERVPVLKELLKPVDIAAMASPRSGALLPTWCRS